MGGMRSPLSLYFDVAQFKMASGNKTTCYVLSDPLRLGTAILVYRMLNHSTGYFPSVNLTASTRRDFPIAEAVRNEMQCNLVYARGAWRRPFPCARAFSPCITLRTWQKRRQFRLPLGTCKCK